MQAALRPKLEAARALGASLLAARDQIGATKSAVEARRVAAAIAGLGSAGADDEAEDEEELRLVGALHEQKEVYRERTAELKQLKMHVGAMQV